MLVERKGMLTENDVICAVARHLSDDGWRIENVSTTDQRGFDIHATKGSISLVVEAKGETSSRSGTARYGKPFTGNQKKSHVAVALYTAASVISGGKHRVGIALPSDNGHKGLIDEVTPALKTLGVVVYLVKPDRSIEEIQ